MAEFHEAFGCQDGAPTVAHDYKPAPRAYFASVEAFGLKPNESMMVVLPDIPATLKAPRGKA